MPVPYRESVILAPASVLQAGTLDQLNQILYDRGLGRPLRRPEPTAPGAAGHELAVLPLAGGADPMAVRSALRHHARERGVDLPELSPDIQYGAGTVEDNAMDRKLDISISEEFSGAGKKMGHGLVAWLSAPSYEIGDSPRWQSLPRRPVIALLDSGVLPHRWLPAPADGQPFFVDATKEYGWMPPVEVPSPDLASPNVDFGSHWGHATFVAGLIRLASPDAQVLSMRVMSHLGKVSEKNVAAALDWLARQVYDGATVDVVLMAFGRQADTADAGDTDLQCVKDALLRLSNLGVTIVASAGNYGSERPVHPADFATDPELSVVSVGARISATERAPYSDYGVWVQEWAQGTNVTSIMPLIKRQTPGDGYAWWSGTSFAAATQAGLLAQRVIQNETSPRR